MCVCTFYTNPFENQVSSSSPSLVNLIRVWPLLSGAALVWTLGAAGAQISGLDPPAHILSVKGALWKTGCKKRPQKNVKKKAADAKNVTNP